MIFTRSCSIFAFRLGPTRESLVPALFKGGTWHPLAWSEIIAKLNTMGSDTGHLNIRAGKDTVTAMLKTSIQCESIASCILLSQGSQYLRLYARWFDHSKLHQSSHSFLGIFGPATWVHLVWAYNKLSAPVAISVKRFVGTFAMFDVPMAYGRYWVTVALDSTSLENDDDND
ncbi:hypothetical protein RSOL_281650 [Rhizoctonia solani AG-3 Rhs1AP]|uniref:Uncharacterized protein n=1 Tax=Rhizoctonia solani AG-3 Rhs1AP TaxID=1086054 RepID=A0A0A1UKT3_9AGAM|nr:hypothetical protein RSOL_281650 [Rhizoctonia solani AG-3 Rhs1AP]